LDFGARLQRKSREFRF
jgi:hypothetical protein